MICGKRLDLNILNLELLEEICANVKMKKRLKCSHILSRESKRRNSLKNSTTRKENHNCSTSYCKLLMEFRFYVYQKTLRNCQVVVLLNVRHLAESDSRNCITMDSKYERI